MILLLLFQLFTATLFAQEDYHFKPAGCEDEVDVKILKNPIVKNDLVITQVLSGTYEGPADEKGLGGLFTTLGGNLVAESDEDQPFKPNTHGKFFKISVKNLHEGFSEFKTEAYIHVDEFKKVHGCLGDIYIPEMIATLLKGGPMVGEADNQNGNFENEARKSRMLDSQNKREPASNVIKKTKDDSH
ncbi:MAG: hypothetical protein JNM93_11620 [Bacteriovoracaceae bacterium]|nr:hypothetical protein [Bacteriovoracaceae bacterium]